jgi:hypothetical protein
MLHPLGGSNADASFAYWGEREDWLVALSTFRDADDVTRSNWTVIVEDFDRRFPEAQNEDWTIESFSNWAFGWTEVLLVRPGTPSAAVAEEWAARLARYPVADDEHHSMLEYDEQWCVRCDRGIRRDHPLNGCQFRSESEADDLKWRWDHRRDR